MKSAGLNPRERIPRCLRRGKRAKKIEKSLLGIEDSSQLAARIFNFEN